MKFKRLEEIVLLNTKKLRRNSTIDSDNGYSRELRELGYLKDSLILNHDLRPSEVEKLNNIEVGEPQIFADAIKDERNRLAENIIL